MSQLLIETVRPATGLTPPPVAATPPTGASGPDAFARMLIDGVDRVDQNVKAADAATQAFAIDDSIPVHQVTFALEQARLSFELMMQVRGRLIDAYQELARMQL